MSATNVTAARIVAGHAHLKVDGVDVGGISGGVAISKATESYEIYVDQLLAPVRIVPTKEVFTVKTNLSESTLTNLRHVWNIPPSKLTGTDGQAGATLKVGISTGVVEHTLEITGVAPNGLIRVVQVHRAVALAASEHSFMYNKETLFPVTFTCLADTSRPAMEEIANVVDVIGTN